MSINKLDKEIAELNHQSSLLSDGILVAARKLGNLVKAYDDIEEQIDIIQERIDIEAEVLGYV